MVWEVGLPFPERGPAKTPPLLAIVWRRLDRERSWDWT